MDASTSKSCPTHPIGKLTDEEWEEVKAYNKKDLDATQIVLEHFASELTAITSLSNRYQMDLRSVHQAGIASRILCTAYRDRHGQGPVRISTPTSVRYTPPAPVCRPRSVAAAEWFDQITTEAFPLSGG